MEYFFLQSFDEFLSGFRDKFQNRVTSVAFSLKFAKTNCVGDALVPPSPALASEANYSKNPSVKSIIFRSFLGS